MTDADLVEGSRRLGFYPLVRLLEQLAGGPAVGTGTAAPAETRVRFRHHPSLAFSTADVASAQEVVPPSGLGEGARVFEVVTTFLGLTGGVSPLPHYLAEEISQDDAEAVCVREFLDIFHHRLLSLLYRALADRDLANVWRAGGEDRWTPRLLALLGIDAVPGEVPWPLVPWRLLRLAPLLAERAVTASALASAVSDAIEQDLGGVPVAVEPFAGTWVSVAADQVTRLGVQGGLLGRNCLVGQRIFDAAGRFRVVIGPLTGEPYQRAMAGDVLHRVEELVSVLVPRPIEHEVVLWLAENAVSALRLGASRLGRDSWVGGQRREERIEARPYRVAVRAAEIP